ncbi:MAG: endonuclease, partial [Bacteroidota bacterium]|nr:endonuclease [Bacteroidota bacterium]
EPPEIIGLAEVENQYVVNLLATRYPLAPFGYRSVHYESPDVRGIDVALLFRPDKFRLLYSAPLGVKLKEDASFVTRDILYSKGLVLGKDTLHLFVNHWPSKLGGETHSAPHRMAAASCLAKAVDSLLAINPAANILVMGDLNDEPHSPVVQSLTDKDRLELNLMDAPLLKKETGSYKFSGKWSVIDQIIVSSELLKENGLHVKNGACIFAASFLLVPDDSFGGEKPFRSFQGPHYTGGYSDHLPVLVDLMYSK